MTDLTPYPDIEEAIRTLLLRDFAADLPTGAHVGVDWPADDSPLPFVRIEKVAPSRRTQLNDYPSVDIEVLAAKRAEAKSLIERIDSHILDYPHSVVISSGQAVLDTVTVPIPPSAREWDSPSVRRYAGTYQFSVRRR
jgi:hypothetical protein